MNTPTMKTQVTKMRRVAHKPGTVTGTLAVMSVAIRRRERGSLDNSKKVALWFEADANSRLTAIANAAGTTRSALAQWLIDQVEVDDDGVPLGWAEEHPKLEELPINGL